MSDIKAGDLVMVVRGAPCCGATKFLGMPFKVFDVRTKEAQCNICGKGGIWPIVCVDKTYAFHMSEVIKIDPPAPPESIERKKELTV
jgi:hypothetical protein